MKAPANPALHRYAQLSMTLWRRSLIGGGLQEFFGSGMAFRFTVLGHILLILVSGLESGSSAQKLVRKLGLVVDDLER